MSITPFTTVPSPTSVGTFDADAWVFFAQLTGLFVTEMNATAAQCVLNATTNLSIGSIQGTIGPTGIKNRVINGDMRIAQRATSATVTAGTTVPTVSTGYPCVDRFYVYSVGGNPTAAQVVGSGSVQNRLQITGAAGVTSIGAGTRIEKNNCYDLAGNTVTLSVDIANSLLTTVTWKASYATTADTFGTIAAPTKTQIATGTFTVNSTVANYQAQISIPAAATTGIEILFTVGAQISGTWTIGSVQLEKNAVATAFEYRPLQFEMALCYRYFELSQPVTFRVFQNATFTAGVFYSFKAEKRVSPTIVLSGTSNVDMANPNTSGVEIGKNSCSSSGPIYCVATIAAHSEIA